MRKEGGGLPGLDQSHTNLTKEREEFLPKLFLLKSLFSFVHHLQQRDHPSIEPSHALPSARWVAWFRAGYIFQFPNVPRINIRSPFIETPTTVSPPLEQMGPFLVDRPS